MVGAARARGNGRDGSHMNLEAWAKRAKTGPAGVVQPGMRAFIRGYAPVVRLAHRPTLQGTEHLPAGPYLLVANHSGGLALAELSSFITCYVKQVGEERRLAGFAHPFTFSIWPFSAILRGLGAVPTTHEAGEKTLAAGVPIIVFPGGDHDSFRPIWQARRVDFAGRRGFLKLARKCGVPVVPMGIRGSHYTAPILWRSRWLLPKLFWTGWFSGVKRLPLTLLGVLGALALLFLPEGLDLWLRALLAWLWIGSPLAAFPWVPWKVQMTIGAPIAIETLFPAHLSDEAQLAHGYERVVGAVQALVTPK